MGVSVDSAGDSKDLMTVYEGGDALAKRLADFFATKKQADDAVAELKLGIGAKEAYADAEKKQTEAANILEKATAAAKAIVEDANKKAEESRQATASEVQEVKSQLNEYVSKKKDDVDSAHQQAQQRLADADTAAKNAEKLETTHREGVAKATEAEAKYKFKTDKLHKALTEALSN